MAIRGFFSFNLADILVSYESLQLKAKRVCMYKQISCSEAHKLMKEKEVVVADVRDLDSYHCDHIDEAIHLSIPMLQSFCEQSDKDIPVIVYCYHGISSRSAAQHLVDHGFSEVYSLDGGYELWKAEQSANDK